MGCLLSCLGEGASGDEPVGTTHERKEERVVRDSHAWPDQLTPAELLALAKDVLATDCEWHSRHVTARNLAALCLVESSGRPKACRYEAHLGESSTGLTQTLLSTGARAQRSLWLTRACVSSEATASNTRALHCAVRWMTTDLGYSKYGVGEAITDKTLEDPRISLYFGCAYLTWLSNYAGKARSDEFTYRGFNGGPNGINLDSTVHYWQKQLKARKEIDAAAKGGSVPVPTPTSAPAKAARGGGGQRTHTVQAGDTFWGLSKRYGVTVEALQAANKEVQPGQIAVGQILALPI